MKLTSALVVLSMLLVGYHSGQSGQATTAPDAENTEIPPWPQDFFTFNKGQLNDQRVVYYSEDVQFMTSSMVYRLVQPLQEYTLQQASMIGAGNSKVCTFRMVFVGANDVRPVGVGELPSKTNYYIGTNPANWVSGAERFESVIYHDLYDGVDLVYRYFQGGLKYEFRLAPGAEITDIKIKYEGATVKTDGTSINIQTPMGTITDRGLYAYQEMGANKKRVDACIYVEQEIVSYAASYNHGLPLIIDPFIYSTFLGGSQDDKALSVTLDDSGNQIVAGVTASPDFPTTDGAFSGVRKGNFDLFVTKFRSDGTGALFSTFIGGLGDDLGAHMALDSSGNIVIAGTTYSRDFPVMPAVGPTNISRSEAYVLKLSPDGSRLLFSSLVGGNDIDACYDMCLDSLDNIYLTGFTCSTDFPVTPGSYDSSFNGGSDVFAVRMNASGLRVDWSTFIGGGMEDAGTAIVVDSSGQCYITGETRSASFPTVNAYDSSFNGGTYDGFALKLAPAGDKLLLSTFIGGEKDDHPSAAGLTRRNTLVLSGYTDSAQFPTTYGCFQQSLNGHIDCFVLELNASGNGLVYSTYLGGFWDDYAEAVEIDSLGTILLTGRTLSGNYPITDSNWSKFKEPETCFISKLSSNGSTLLYSSFVGCGKGNDLFVSAANLVVLAGETPDAQFPVTAGASDGTFNGQRDAFLVCAELPSAPFAPTNLTAKPGGREVRLDWSLPGNGSFGNIVAYRIYRGSNPSALSRIKDTDSNFFIDKGLTNGRQYFYAVSAINEIGEGLNSTVAMVIPGSTPSKPQNLQGSLNGTEVLIQWKQPSDNGGFAITHYNVYNGNTSSDMRLVSSTPGLTFRDQNVTSGNNYYYKVTAVNERGEGPPTDTRRVFIGDVEIEEPKMTLIFMIVGTLLAVIAVVVIIFRRLHARRNRTG